MLKGDYGNNFQATQYKYIFKIKIIKIMLLILITIKYYHNLY